MTHAVDCVPSQFARTKENGAGVRPWYHGNEGLLEGWGMGAWGLLFCIGSGFNFFFDKEFNGFLNKLLLNRI